MIFPHAISNSEGPFASPTVSESERRGRRRRDTNLGEGLGRRLIVREVKRKEVETHLKRSAAQKSEHESFLPLSAAFFLFSV